MIPDDHRANRSGLRLVSCYRQGFSRARARRPRSAKKEEGRGCGAFVLDTEVQLIIALWRYVNTGLVPEGFQLRSAA